MGDLRKTLQSLERLANVPGYATEETAENDSDNDAESNGRGEDRHLGVGYNEEVEYVDECGRDDHSYAEEINKTITQSVLEYEEEDGLKPININNIELDGEEIAKKVDNFINMEERIAPREQETAVKDVQIASFKYLSDSEIMEQSLVDGDIKEEATGGGNVKSFDVVGAEISEEHMGHDGVPN